ncbi:hypothetical protein [Magnetospira sp. QH-2]|uniref:hypothetical protein n=1 Tax=Magnetospira sp. (strain QH-2) TaxID=1288970 RepID=UPI0003E80A5A|nr:hypothetical protein [Magnetospira sp. QH-2]CCQ73065.1 protein of unknown function [Magnetospira sp. QH-2]
MRVAFYIDPIVDDGLPYRRIWWLYNSITMMLLLESDASQWTERFRIITNRHLADKALEGVALPAGPAKGLTARVPPDCLKIISFRETLDIFGQDSLTTNGRWLSGRYEPDEALRYGTLIKDRLDWEPEIIVSFSASPFLRAAFPACLVLNWEAGIFSTAPFPNTGFLDPMGTFRSSFLVSHADEVKSHRSTPEEQRMLATIRSKYLSGVYARTNPFTAAMGNVRERFKSTWVWPTVWARSFGWDWDAPIDHTFDYLCWVLDEVGPDVGVTVSEHPKRRHYWDDEKKEYLRRYFPNFMIIPNEYQIRGASQYLLQLVDGCIGMGSMTGEHAPLFGKKLVTPCKNHLTPYSDATSLENLSDLAHEPPPAWRDPALIWKLTRYYVPYDLQFSPGWFQAAFERWLGLFRAGEIDMGYYEPAAPSADILKIYAFQEVGEMPERWPDIQ